MTDSNATVRVSGVTSFLAGTLAPRKFDLICIEYENTITHTGYFSVAPDGTAVFLSRVETEVDGNGAEIRIQLFTTRNGRFPA